MARYITSFHFAHIVFLIPWLLLLASFTDTNAQCASPTGATISTSPALCQGQGKIMVDTVTGANAGEVFQYQLRYDSASNTSVVKPWQSSPIFNDVFTGQYKAEIRKVCGTGYSVPYVSGSITVSGTTTSLTIQQVIRMTKTSCNNGSFKVRATGGYSAGGYSYALVPALNASEPVVAYVRPPQDDSVFNSLSAGTYYARVYDSCGTYVTAPVNIDSVTENAIVSKLSTSTYSCDSLQYRFSVRVDNRYASGYADTNEKFWVTYDGVTDTLSGAYFSFTSTNNASTATFSKMLQVTNGYPIVVTVGYRSLCGNVYTRTDTMNNPKLKISVTSNSVSCTEKRYVITARDSINGNSQYFNTRLSVDSGTTFSDLNTTGATYYDTFVVGNTYHLVLASDCDTARLTVTVTNPVMNFSLNEFTAYSCNDNSGFSISVFSSGYSGNIDSIKFYVLEQPVAGSLPDSFYRFQNNIYKLTYDLPPGTYKLAAIDQCGSVDTEQITINPTVYDYTIEPMLACLASASGFRLNVTETNYKTYSGFSNIRAIVTNTSTGAVDSFLSATNSRPTYVEVTGIPAGTYQVRVIKVRPSSLPYPTCSVDTVVESNANQPLSLSQSLFVTPCQDGTATIGAYAVGGGGGYEFILDIQNSDGSWDQVQGPQEDPIFNDLNADSTYRVRVTDTCGSGTQYTTSFSGAAQQLHFSSDAHPCPGDSFTMSVTPYPDATYQWFKDDVILPGDTTEHYTINPVPGIGIIDSYYVRVTLGDCELISGQYVLDPADCGAPLPVNLVSFSGRFSSNNQALLEWKVTPPEMAAAFDVEYSADAVRFNKITTINGNHQEMYQYTDIVRDDSKLYYRLKITGHDGESTYSPVIILVPATAGMRMLKVYPNIVTDRIHVSYTTFVKEKLNWKLLDVTGQVIRKGSFNIRSDISELSFSNLYGLAPGNYILYFDNGSSFHHTEKIIIQP